MIIKIMIANRSISIMPSDVVPIFSVYGNLKLLSLMGQRNCVPLFVNRSITECESRAV